ncbi:MAG: biopolymer transporter ExbD [Bryobacteraceae bacterium]|nr:biopolymer transporter ExbD [Bryobacteraceae bacterium]MDW8379189.1 biopolymer transporter ExbD [Bryobacterales bacterium]
MAFSTGGLGNMRPRRRGDLGVMSEINVVPLVDVVLVLLIIFMLTAQVMEFGLEIDVPKVNQERASAQELPVISMTAQGLVYLNERELKLVDLKDEVLRRFGPQTKAVYVRADKNVTWDVLAQLVSAIGEAKLEVRLVTKPQDLADLSRRR